MTITPHSAALAKELLTLVRDFPDFPKPGILFKDISPLMRNPQFFQKIILDMASAAKKANASQIIGIESRGFLFGVPLALHLGLPFVTARKKGKLPGPVLSASYALEYGNDALEIQADALPSRSRSFVVDDVMATGGTALAIAKIIEQSAGELAGFCFLIELGFLQGREKLLQNNPNAFMHSSVIV
jgi:adenine phosphoribosyltransferase